MENSYSNPYSSSQYGPGYGQNITNKPHSPLGIASFALSCFAGVFLLLAVVVAGYLETTMKGGLDENSTTAGVLGLAVVGLLGLDFIAIVLGAAGLFQWDRKRIFAVLGIFLSSLALLAVISLIVIGSLA